MGGAGVCKSLVFLVIITKICQFGEAVLEKETAVRGRYTWVCRNEICEKELSSALQPNENGQSMGICKLNCAKNGALWPLPTGKVEIGRGTFDFFPQNVKFTKIEGDENVKRQLGVATEIFEKYLLQMHPDERNDPKFNFPLDQNSGAITNQIHVHIAVVYPDSPMKIGMDESYTLSWFKTNDGKTIEVTLFANTFYGARHGLETLSQLIAFNDYTETLTIVEQALISDKPFYAYRGILMDTSRNFMSLPTLKRIIDGLSYNKLNHFHWHITDTHSFPFQSKRRPLLTEYGAYSSRKVYSVAQMKELVEYGKQRGVRVLPEFDAPAHVGNGWEWGPSQGLGNLAVCINKEKWFDYCVEPPCGQLNPANENMYEVLGDLYKDFFDIFQTDVFHMGGDEVFLHCWNSTEEITSWMKGKGMGLTTNDLVAVWSEFQDKAYAKLVEASGREKVDVILWTSELVSEKHAVEYLSNETYIIQIWNNGYEEGKVIPFLIKNGYRSIFSQVDPWYFDCGYGAWVGNGHSNWCSPYKGWQQVYMNNPINILANYTGMDFAQEAYRKGLILGGEAAMWSEQVDDVGVEHKVWPRGAALAERLWSNPSTGWYASEPRMLDQRERFVQRGLRPDSLQPEWCHQNHGGCLTE